MDKERSGSRERRRRGRKKEIKGEEMKVKKGDKI